MTETISLRIDKDARIGMKKVCDEIGLSMSTAFNMFAKLVARERKIPINMDLNITNEIPNKETIKAIENVKKKKNLSKTFNSVSELMRDLNA